MYDFLLDIADQATIQPTPVAASVGDRSHLDVYMTRYQKQRQRVYDRARHLVDGRNHSRVEVRDAKAEAGLVGSEARISRERGTQLMWIRSLIQNHGAARYGYSSPLDLVVSRADMHRSTARDLVYLARRLSDGEIERIRAGEISYTRVLEETRLREAGASGKEIARTRDMDLDSVRRVTQKRRKVTRADERKVFDSQYVAFQPSLDGTHTQVMGRLGAYEGEICRKALNQLGDELALAGETRPEAGTRRALALTTLCLDELDRDATSASAAKRELPPPSSRREPLLMVVADGSLTQTSGFEQGAAILAGPRVGPDTIDLILCTGRTANITTTGQHITNHTSSHFHTPRVAESRPRPRRRMHHRRLQFHLPSRSPPHPRTLMVAERLGYRIVVSVASKGGDNSAEKLTTLCWWHHHVAVHRQGMRIDPQSPPRRRRLLHPRANCGYQPPAPDPHTLAIRKALNTPTNRAPRRPG